MNYLAWGRLCSHFATFQNNGSVITLKCATSFINHNYKNKKEKLKNSVDMLT